MGRTTLAVSLLACPLLLFAPAVATPFGEQRRPMAFLDNGVITVGVDLDRGGSIAFLGDTKQDNNLVNIHDLGRYIGQSYYAGPRPYGKPHRDWKDWPWNPVSAGDVYGNSSRLVVTRSDGKTLYVKSTPTQWALKNVPADCRFETWITLHARTVQVRNRLTNHRADRTQYPAMDQELPAVYTVGTLHRLFTYDGEQPFTDGPLTEIQPRPAKGNKAQWNSFFATENWAALVDDNDRGLGVFHAAVFRFLGGFYGKPGSGGPEDNATGYIAPVRRDILDHDIAYEYRYTLVLDSLTGIRQYARQHRPSNLPDYRFDKDRQHWWLVNAADERPERGRWQVQLEKDDPQLVGPECFWDAAEVPKLSIRAAFHTRGRRAEVFWKTREHPEFSPDRRVQFPVQPDGEFHTYEVDLAGSPSYRGKITGLRLDPIETGSVGERVEIERVWYER